MSISSGRAMEGRWAHFPLQLGTRKGVRVTTWGKEGPESTPGGYGELGEPGKQCSATERLTGVQLPCFAMPRSWQDTVLLSCSWIPWFSCDYLYSDPRLALAIVPVCVLTPVYLHRWSDFCDLTLILNISLISEAFLQISLPYFFFLLYYPLLHAPSANSWSITSWDAFISQALKAVVPLPIPLPCPPPRHACRLRVSST